MPGVRVLLDGQRLLLEYPQFRMQFSLSGLQQEAQLPRNLLLHIQTHNCSGLALVPGRHGSLPCSLRHLDDLEQCLQLGSRLGILHIFCHQSQSHCHLGSRALTSRK